MDLRRDERLGNGAWDWGSESWVDGGKSLTLGNNRGCGKVTRPSMN